MIHVIISWQLHLFICSCSVNLVYGLYINARKFSLRIRILRMQIQHDQHGAHGLLRMTNKRGAPRRSLGGDEGEFFHRTGWDYGPFGNTRGHRTLDGVYWNLPSGLRVFWRQLCGCSQLWGITLCSLAWTYCHAEAMGFQAIRSSGILSLETHKDSVRVGWQSPWSPAHAESWLYSVHALWLIHWI